MANMNNNQKNNTKLLIILLALVTLAAICVTVWALFFRKPDVVLAPDYAPQETEANAEAIPDDSGDKMDAPEGGGAVSLIYMTDVTIDLSDKSATLMFGNPQKSTQDMVVQIVVKDTVIAQSGKLTPGNRVTTLDLLADAPKLGAGTYTSENCKFVVLYYNQESGEKAILNTEIPITVTVQE